MILTDRQIVEAQKKGDILIDPFDEKQIQPASYDLRVGAQGATTTTKELVDIKKRGYLAIEPGDFGILITLEEIRLDPQYTARFGLRSKYARKGLVATTGPQIDPGYHGRLIIGVSNLTPNTVSIPYKDDLLTVEFHKLEEAATNPYSGPYQDKMELGPEEIEFIVEREGFALSEIHIALKSLSKNVGQLSADVKALQSLSKKVGELSGDVRTMKWSIWSVAVIVAFGIAVITFVADK